MFRIVLFGFVVQQASGVINRLTPLEYDKLPKLMKVDDFDPCMRVPGDVFCSITASLHGNRSDPLYNTIVEYSENTVTHYNHTNIRWHICPKTTCAQHMNSSSNITEVIEACLNETLTRDYRLTAKIYESSCQEFGKGIPWDAGDYAFGIGMLIIVALNALGSLYDIFCHHGKDTFVGRFMLCFSVKRNWSRLVAPSSTSRMHRRVKVLSSMKAISAFLVMFGHSPLNSLILVNTPLFIEETYHHVLFQLMYNGTLVIQTFFTISALLLAYNYLLSEEKRPPSWQDLPKTIFLRWLRLTPVYALVTFFVMTWARHSVEGPFVKTAFLDESEDCHRDWWLHLLYIHNYKDHSQCMAHAWYLAADFQLTVLGCLIFCMVHNNRSRKIVIGLVMTLGFITPAAQTYFQNLHPLLIVSPEVGMKFFVEDPTFNNLYKRGHTNITSYGMGLVMGYIIYNLKESDLGSKKFKKYRFLYYALIPLMLLVVFAGRVFYMDDVVIPRGVSAAYASVVKVIYNFMTLLFIFFTIAKVDTQFRGFLHWGGWARISRVTYLTYLVHVPVLRFIAGNSTELVPVGVIWFVKNYCACIVIAFLLAVPLYVTVEAPIAEVVKVVMFPSPRPKKVKPVTMEDIKSSKETIEVKL